jgi:uncharacterized protein (DUF488 family)
VELTELLRHHKVTLLVDVRTIPASRRMPHFAKAALERSLPEHGIRYLHMPELGGLRKPIPDSTNAGWRKVGFRGYADYMQTDEFWTGIDRLLALAKTDVPTRRPAAADLPSWRGGEMVQVAIMCAEAVPWRCHRSLISDALTVGGEEVRHITAFAEPSRHSVTPFARVQDGRITYPPPDTLGL